MTKSKYYPKITIAADVGEPWPREEQADPFALMIEEMNNLVPNFNSNSELDMTSEREEQPRPKFAP